MFVGRVVRLFCMVAMCILCVGFAVQADDESWEGRHCFSLGRVTPLSPDVLRENWKPGYFLGYAYFVEVASFADLGGKAELGILGFDYDRGYGYKPDDVSHAMLFITLVGYGRFYIPAFPYPYLTATFGTGGFLDGPEEEAYDERANFGGLALSAGAGINIPVSKINIVLDVQYAIITKFSNTITYWPVKIEVVMPYGFGASK